MKKIEPSDYSNTRFAAVASAIRNACARSGRTPEDVALVAVSKTHSPEAIRELAEQGQLLFGESRIQEARAKIPLCPNRLHWHFIGHLQRNKIRAALPLFELFHGVDSASLALDIDRIAGELGLRPRVLIEVNLAGESSKFGFAPAAVEQDLDRLLSLPRVQVEGLMTIPPPAEKPEDSRRYFAGLRELRDRLQTRAGTGLPHLSMGMSGDFETAIEEGATLVRVGTALFGERRGAGWTGAQAQD